MTTLPEHPSANCDVCQTHLLRRGKVLIAAVIREAVARDISPVDLLRRHMLAIHGRHLAGLALHSGDGERPKPRRMPRRPVNETASNVLHVERRSSADPSTIDPCLIGAHMWAYLAAGGQACYRCGKRR